MNDVFEISGHEVLRKETVKTEKQEAIVKTHYAMLYKIQPSISEATILTGETINIMFEWLIFDLNLAEYVKDTNKSDAFQVEVNGQRVDMPVGEALIFSSDEPGEYLIRTFNQNVENAEVKVVVESA